jgi:hypothetical protein
MLKSEGKRYRHTRKARELRKVRAICPVDFALMQTNERREVRPWQNRRKREVKRAMERTHRIVPLIPRGEKGDPTGPP